MAWDGIHIDAGVRESVSRALHNTIPVYISQNLYRHILPTKHQNAQHFHDNIGDLCVHIRLERFFDLKISIFK